MSEMIERLAKAVFLTRTPFEGVGCCNDPDFMKCWACAAECRSIACDVLEAMKDYTEEMSVAGGAVPITQFGGDGLRCGQSVAERAYLAMISEALQEEK